MVPLELCNRYDISSSICEGILTCFHSERVRATEATVGLSVLIYSRSSQALLDSLSGVRQIRLITTKAGTNMLQAYDGIRRRTLPILYDALKPGTEDDRMKGALWTLNNGIFGNVPPCFYREQSLIPRAYSQICHGR